MLILVSALLLLAEEPEGLVMDTIHLDEITTYGDYIKYQPGAKIVTLSGELMETTQEGGLDQLLSRFIPVYIKSDAGGLSTIHIRGTGASHTTINFGGININSLTLGQSNLSSISSFLFDQLELQYGSSSALNGSGAIGGTIYLGQYNHWTNGARLNAKMTQGAFGEQLYGTKIFLGNGKFESVTRLYYYQKENNFPFKNPYTGNVENREPIDDIQHGAAIKTKGLLQEFNYLFSPNAYLKSSVWFDDNWYQIQPNMQSNLTYTSAEEMHNQNIRTWAEYKNENHDLKYTIGAGYVHDFQQYNNIADQKIITDRVVAEAAIKQTVFKKIDSKLGAKYRYIVPDVYAYSDSLIDHEQQMALYLSVLFQPIQPLRIALNLRQQFITNFDAPFTPSLGAEYLLSSNEMKKISVTANFSKSYRVPTFNDRYWVKQGNPNLKAETGLNLETGLNYCITKTGHVINMSVNLFYLDVDNWIEWRNQGVWIAQNVKRVISKGVEFHFDDHFEILGAQSELTLNYTMNIVRQADSGQTLEANSKQLIYTPMNMGNISYLANYHKFGILLNGTYTGERYSDYLGSKLKAYFLTNCGAFYRLPIKEQEFKLSFTLNNLFNVNYQNEKYYAMPGINWQFSISTTLKHQSLNN